MTQYLPILLGGAVFLVVLGIGLLVYGYLAGGRTRQAVRRLEDTHVGGRRRGAAGGAEWVERMAAGGQQLDRMLKDPEETTILLAQAGWRGARGRALYYAVQVAVPALALLLSVPLFLAFREPWGAANTAVVCLIVVIMSILVPRWLLRRLADKRRERLRAEVPLFINLLILLFEAGLSTRQALNTLVQDGEATLPTLAEELRPVMRQVEAGGDLNNLLYDLGKTLNVPELESVLSVLRQVERYGGEIREPLTDALQTIEERRVLEVREMVNVMSGKMTVVLVACFLPALLIIIVGPAFVSIIEGFSGL